MLSFRLFTHLLVFSFLNGWLAESDNKAPSNDKEKPSQTSKTELPLTTKTAKQLCKNGLYVAFARKNGWWCSKPNYLDREATTLYSTVFGNCEDNGDVLSSLETDEEFAYYADRFQNSGLRKINGVWMGASYNECEQKWFWDDGNAIRTMEPQPTLVTPGGHVAWFITEGNKVLKVSNSSLYSKVIVNGYICGHPGRII